MVMKRRVSRPLPSLSVVAALAFFPFASSAQNARMMGGCPDHMMGGCQDHMMGGGMMGGGQDHMMGGGQDHMMGGGMMGGGQDHAAGGGQDHMSRMMSMMHEKLAHAGDRVASLKAELKITEAQTPAWNKFADALLAAAKSMEQSMEAMQQEMMQHAAPAAAAEQVAKDYPDFGAVKKTTGGAEGAKAVKDLPAKLEHHEKMLKERLVNLEAIKEALGPLYASFSDDQKKIADGLKIGPMGVM
jgi:LTXXQ motif family protein